MSVNSLVNNNNMDSEELAFGLPETKDWLCHVRQGISNFWRCRLPSSGDRLLLTLLGFKEKSLLLNYGHLYCENLNSFFCLM